MNAQKVRAAQSLLKGEMSKNALQLKQREKKGDTTQRTKKPTDTKTKQTTAPWQNEDPRTQALSQGYPEHVRHPRKGTGTPEQSHSHEEARSVCGTQEGSGRCQAPQPRQTPKPKRNREDTKPRNGRHPQRMRHLAMRPTNTEPYPRAPTKKLKNSRAMT